MLATACSGVIVEYNTYPPRQTQAMNRKLRNTILAFSVTGMVLAVGLIAARPVLPAQPLQAADNAGTTVLPVADELLARPSGQIGSTDSDLATRADAISVRIQARSRQYEAALVDARSIEQTVRLTVGFVTTVVGESLLARPMDADEAPATAREDERPATPARSGRSVRSTIAVPYFSFARGTVDRS